ncbi:glycosyltransferase family 2 protein [Adhaeribacter pallidiroseus]|uniref:Glycosyltransferase 2-like domain-containing protein n=1 Tax=Adhaeribacter pallidiroseus TaxID=2072847 RepID=A0A369QTD5_9BACT|nr:glycosyltransferase family 2 protein [Adhaeribacter pallidiroseus]RDC66089.1 hypothetical protein AHMF7616_04720 [Adhaeribacter pallidiroseus]
MSDNILFSVGIPAYKGRYLEECINSILVQTFANFELIVINDYSPDSIDSIIDQYCDSRISYYKNERNVGAEHVVDNWNKCLNYANGEYFVLMGDDDKMEPDYLEEFAKLIALYPDLDVFHCRSKIINEDSFPIMLTQSCPEFETVYENIWQRIVFQRRQFISDFVFRTSVLKHNGGFFKLPLAWASDDISTFVACGKKGIAHINKPVFNYRESRYNITSTGNSKLKLEALNGAAKWINDFLDKEPEKASDQLIYTILKNQINDHVLKARTLVVRHSIRNNIILGTIDWWLNRKKYLLSTKDIIMALVRRS